jgi:uncharacterized protein (DUF427 family)
MGLMETVRRVILGNSPEPGQRVRATWQEVTLAESDATVVVENNHYFPSESVDRTHLRESETHTVCPWKGQASNLDVVLEDGMENRDAAWYYPHPKQAAEAIRIASRSGVG